MLAVVVGGVWAYQERMRVVNGVSCKIVQEQVGRSSPSS